MRILRVAQKVYPDVEGGGAYHVHAMSRDQARMGHDVTVLTIRTESSQPHVEQREGYTVVRFDTACSPLGNDMSPGIATYLRESGEYDVIHAHSHLYFATNLAAFQRLLGSVPLAITNHGLYSQTAPEWVFRLYLRTLGRWTFDRADVVFCYTAADRERVRACGVSSPVAVVPNGIDTERFTPEGPDSELVNATGPVVLFVGRLVEGKRPDIAVSACAKLLDAHPDVELYLCGDGPLRERLMAQVRELGIGESVTFLGQVPYGEMPKVYRSADVLVLPSRAEGVPRTIMEALSAGVPVVSSALPQVQSAFGDSVAYVECGDVDGFREQIAGVLDDGRATGLADRFRWERTVEETTARLEAIATARGK